MPTPAYTPLDRNAPDGATGTGTTYSAADLANVRAIADAITLGRAPGWTQARSGGTANQPAVITYSNGTLALRVTITWTGFNPTTLTYDWSNDSGATWATIGSAAVLTFDANQNVTANTNSGGIVTLVMEIWAKVLKAVSDLTGHAAATGTAVHGVGTLSTQNANAIAATGGTLEDVAIGATTPDNVDMTRARETIHDYGAIANGATVTLEVDKYGYMKFTPSATTSHTVTIALSGTPPAGRTQTFTLEVVNGRRSADAKITWDGSLHWIAGTAARPLDTALELAGSNLFAATWNGATWDINHEGKRG